MIELIVALVLTTIALAVFVTGMIGALRGSTDVRSSSVSNAELGRTLDAIDDDVARAFAVDRQNAKVRDPLELKDALQRNRTPMSSDPADNGALLRNFDDVVRAQATQLQLQLGTTCVTWEALRAGDGSFVVQRRPGPACGAGTAERFLTVAPNVDPSAFDATPFEYTLVCNRTECPGAAPAPAGDSECSPWAVTGNVPAAQRRWITAVTTSLTNVDGDRTASRAVGSSTSTIRSRETDDYRAGLGC